MSFINITDGAREVDIYEVTNSQTVTPTDLMAAIGLLTPITGIVIEMVGGGGGGSGDANGSAGGQTSVSFTDYNGAARTLTAGGGSPGDLWFGGAGGVGSSGNINPYSEFYCTGGGGGGGGTLPIGGSGGVIVAGSGGSSYFGGGSAYYPAGPQGGTRGAGGCGGPISPSGTHNGGGGGGGGAGGYTRTPFIPWLFFGGNNLTVTIGGGGAGGSTGCGNGFGGCVIFRIFT